MRTPDEVRARVKITWERQWAGWLGGGGEWPRTFALDSPTERVAQAHFRRFGEWVQTWAGAPLGGQVTMLDRTWSTLGRQQVPSHVSFHSAREIAAAVGPDAIALYEAAEARFLARVEEWSDLSEVLRVHARWMADLEERDYQRFVTVVNWLAANPDTGMYVRQLPIGGLDSKWVERHAGPIARLVGARHGRSGGLAEVAGLKVDGPRRRIRILDPTIRSMIGGVSDLSVRLDELATLDLPVRVALVVENQQTALACQDLPGAIVLMGGGFAVKDLGRVRWLDRVPLVYWGDIDTAGLTILSALRRYHAHTVSCLMDEMTLLRFRDLWSEEDVPTHAAGEGLGPDEESLRLKLLSGHFRKQGPGVRLEQERIPWPFAWSAIQDAVATHCVDAR